MRRAALAGIGAALLLADSSPAAEFLVGSGSSFDLGSGSLDLGCGDLAVDGTFSAGSVGFAAARDVAIAPGGVLNGNAATLEVAGDWDNAGTFNADTSSVRLVDGCGLLSAVVAGNSAFTNLELTTASAKQVSFTAGSTQTVTGSLSLSGVFGALLKIRSTLGGLVAFLHVQGTSSASYVDVQDNDATAGNPIALGPDSIKGPNTPGWVFPVPALSYPLHPVYTYARFQIGNGLPIPIVPFAPPLGGIVIPAATFPFPTSPATVMQGSGVDPLSIMISPGVLKAAGPPVVNVPVLLANPAVFQVATSFSISWPASPVTFKAGGRTGPSAVTWCPGFPLPTASYNPACTAASKGAPKGLLRYAKTKNQFGGPGAGKIGAGKAIVAFAAKFTPGCPGTSGCLASFNNAYGAYPWAIGNKFGVVGSSYPSPVMPGVFPVNVTGKGAITKIYASLGMGTGPTNYATSFAGPWTTGMLTVSVTDALGMAEVFVRTGSDMRVSGVGRISLIAGAVSARTLSGPNANRGWVTLYVPEPGAAGGAAGALIALATCHALVRRRSRPTRWCSRSPRRSR